MRLVHSTHDFVVYDDFLGADDCALVRHDFRHEQFRFVNAVRWDRVYRLGDGVPLENAGYLSTPLSTASAEIGAIRTPGFARFAAALDALAPGLSSWVGRKDEHWHCYTLRPTIYPRGASLSWHDDGKNRTGAFAYYAHSHWRARWGGELLVAGGHSAGCGQRTSGEFSLVHDDTYDEAVLAEVGTYIAPKPNRLVVMRNGVVHAVRSVEAAAGDHVRASLSGFFVTKGALSQALAETA